MQDKSVSVKLCREQEEYIKQIFCFQSSKTWKLSELFKNLWRCFLYIISIQTKSLSQKCLSYFMKLDIKEAVYQFFLLLSLLFFVLIRILKLFTLHHLCIKLCWIQKYKFYWCKTTTAGVMGQRPQNSCIWPQCAPPALTHLYILYHFIWGKTENVFLFVNN